MGMSRYWKMLERPPFLTLRKAAIRPTNNVMPRQASPTNTVTSVSSAQETHTHTHTHTLTHTHTHTHTMRASALLVHSNAIPVIIHPCSVSHCTDWIYTTTTYNSLCGGHQ